MPATIIDYQDTAVEVHRLVVGPVDNNVYIVRCRSTGESLLIDAANEHDKLLELCEALTVRKVVETHGHWDHIQAVEAVRNAGIDVAVAYADADIDGGDTCSSTTGRFVCTILVNSCKIDLSHHPLFASSQSSSSATSWGRDRR